jgi:hypothetical protein
MWVLAVVPTCVLLVVLAASSSLTTFVTLALAIASMAGFGAFVIHMAKAPKAKPETTRLSRKGVTEEPERKAPLCLPCQHMAGIERDSVHRLALPDGLIIPVCEEHRAVAVERIGVLAR